MTFHVLTGLPRSGSTLLANILNQNPRFHVSSTSPLCQIVSQISATVSGSPEFKSDLAGDRKATEERLTAAVRGFIKGWYAGRGEVCFDKGRGWTLNALALTQAFPQARLIVCVRDLRNVFASVEKQHRRNPLLDTAAAPQEKAIYNRADEMFGPTGIIGLPITGVEDLLRRSISAALVVRYEDLVERPRTELTRIYEAIHEPWFEHDFTNIANTATDLDALYLNKFPHEGSGPVKPSPADEWRGYYTEDLATTIMQRFEGYNKAFGYGSA